MSEVKCTNGPKREETLVEKALGIKSRLLSLSIKSDEIHGALFGTRPFPCEDLDGIPPLANLEYALNDITKIITELEDSLGDTRNRL